MLNTKVIKMNRLVDIVDFVNNAASKEYIVICKRDNYIVNANSLMGVIGLDPSEPFAVIYDCDDTEYEEYLKQFTSE